MPKKKSASKKKCQKKQTQYYQRSSLKNKLWEAETYEERNKIRAKINNLK